MKRFPLAALTVSLAATMAGSAHADSRLFSIQTDTPGVTVTAAAANGTALANVGGDGAVTFFRIDNPSGAVPCSAGMTLSLSSGSSIQRNIDFCAAGWDVVVTLAQSQPPAQPPPSFGNVTITTDDPSGVIIAVFVGGSSVPLQSSAGQSVSVSASALAGAQSCERDIGVELIDGRRMARNVNVCVGSGQIVVPITGQGGQVAQPAQPLPQPTQPQPVQPPAPSQPQIVADMQWLFENAGTGATLSFANPATGFGELSASCETGTERARLILARPVPGLNPGGSLNVRFRAGTFNQSYAAVGSDYGDPSAGYLPQLDLSTGDPLWQAIIRESTLFVTLGGGAEYGLSLKGSAAATRPFLAVCNPAPARPSAPPPSQRPGPVSFFCNDGRSLTVVFDNRNGVASAYDGPNGPIVLQRVEDGATVRYTTANAELVGSGESITWRFGPRPPTACRPN